MRPKPSEGIPRIMSRVKLDLELPEPDRYEAPTDITVQDVAREFGISPGALARSLRKHGIRTELMDDTVFNPKSNGFLRFKVSCLLFWQVKCAVEIAWDVYSRAMHRPSKVRRL